jgi:type III secretion protein V
VIARAARLLEALALRRRGTPDVLLAAAVLGAVSLLVAPVPPAVVDAGLALSLGLSAALLLAALLSREPLQLTALPSVLLLTTVLRLALSVASTRLVLVRGEAGRVVRAMGEAVVGGNLVAGAVVFAVVTLVQILVVTKGAERVAEVAARFALDALPGKQMSVDADLRAGAIDAADARRRRRELEREGRLHGAMDGALKFVKGDALAGVAIALVNVGGGLATGLLRGLPLETALRRYAVLAVGDGLAAQVPGLLVSVAAGVAVTRVADEEGGGSLGADLARQLLGDPRALGAAAALLAALALAPGLPAAPFGLLAAAAAAGAAWRRVGAEAAPAAAVPAEEDLEPAAPLLLELAPDLHALACAQGRFLAELEPFLRDALWREMGVRLPPLAVAPGALAPGRWRLAVDEVPLAAGRAEPGLVLALAPPGDLALAGIEGSPARHPRSGAPALAVDAALSERAAALGPVLAPLDRVAAGAAAALCRGAHLLLDVEAAQDLLAALEQRFPALAREASRQLPPALLAEVLRRLLEEGVPLRGLRAAVQAALEAGGAARPAAELAEACRRALGRQLAHRLAPDGPLEALLLDPSAEARFRQALAGGPPLEPGQATALLDGLAAALGPGPRPPVLLAGAPVRRAVRDLVAPRFPDLRVLAYEELPPDWPVAPRGRVAGPTPEC